MKARTALLLAAALLVPAVNAALGWNALAALCQVLIYVILAVGLNVIVGLAGLLHLGYAAFFAVGAFTMAYLTSPQSPLNWQWGFWPALGGAVLVTTAVGALLSWPTLRLRGDYLAIVTMGFGLMIDPILRNYDDTTKAITGMSAIASPDFFGYQLTPGNSLGWYYLLLAWGVVCIALSRRLRDSRIGRSLKAQREDEVAAAACGIDLVQMKLVASLWGAAVAGLGGGLYASFIYTLNLAFPLDFNGSIMVLAMVIFGGVGSLRGSVVGALCLGIINLVLTPAAVDLVNRSVIPNLTGVWAGLAPYLDLSKAQFLLFGLTLVLMMLLRPQGMLPEQPRRYPSPEETP